MDYVYTKFDNCFWVYSDMGDVCFLVEVAVESMVEEAKEIADREIGYWLNPEESPNPDYYENAGYVAVVRDALMKKNIYADYYVMEEM